MPGSEEIAVRQQAEPRKGTWKLLVVVDETPECNNALRFAARRARLIGGGVKLLNIIHPRDFQHWVAVEEVMREEAHEEAEELLRSMAADMQRDHGVLPELVVREGKPSGEILALIEEDLEIRVLVLGAGTGSEGPGPLVSSFSGQLLGSLPVPVTIVPGHLAMERIDEIT